MPLPFVGIDGFKHFRRKRSIDNGTDFRKRRRLSGCQNLYRDIAKSGRFGRPRQDSSACGIGGELIEQPILRAPANDVNLIDMTAADLFKVAHDEAILQSQTLQDAPDVGPRSWWTGLIR